MDKCCEREDDWEASGAEETVKLMEKVRAKTREALLLSIAVKKLDRLQSLVDMCIYSLDRTDFDCRATVSETLKEYVSVGIEKISEELRSL
jgi:hypothetical protein